MSGDVEMHNARRSGERRRHRELEPDRGHREEVHDTMVLTWFSGRSARFATAAEPAGHVLSTLISPTSMLTTVRRECGVRATAGFAFQSTDQFSRPLGPLVGPADGGVSSPEQSEALAVPGKDGFRLDDDQEDRQSAQTSQPHPGVDRRISFGALGDWDAGLFFIGISSSGVLSVRQQRRMTI